MTEPAFTLTAGPVAASPRVLAALGAQITYDYDPLFLERFRRTQRKVANDLPHRGRRRADAGRGRARSRGRGAGRCHRGSTCLNLVSGVYAKWFGEWLRALGANVIEHEVPYNSSIDPADVESLLAQHPEISVVAVVHCETPSGTLNPIREIGLLARAHGAIVICDVVSSLAGNDVRVDEWGLDICVAGPQKCLASGTRPLARDRQRARMGGDSREPLAPRHSYLSLLDWHRPGRRRDDSPTRRR